MEDATRPGQKIVFIFIGLIILRAVLTHYSATSAFFYNDDFGHLERVASGVNLPGILKSFLPSGHVYGSRPVGELYFFTCYRLFGPDPKAFHLVSLFIHVVNVVLVFFTIRKISKNNVIALIAGLIFASHFALAGNVMWAGAIYDLTAGLFFFGALLLYLYRDGNRFLCPLHICSLLSFFIALRAKEMAITLPAVLLLFEIVNSSFAKSDINRGLWRLVEILRKQSLYYVIGMAYIVLTFMGSTGLPKEGPYAFQFDIHTFLEGVAFYSKLLLLKPPVPYLVFYIIMLVSLMASFILKNRCLIFSFLFLWLSLLPVIFLANHRYEIYLYIPLLGFTFFLSNTFFLIARFFAQFSISYSKAIRIAIVTVFSFAFMFLNYPRLRLEQGWLRTEANNYERCVNQLRELHPTLPHGAHLYFLGLPPNFIEFRHWEKVAYPDPSLISASVNKTDLDNCLTNEKDNFYVFKYTKRKLSDITAFYNNSSIKEHNSPPYTELIKHFDVAKKQTPYPNQIYLDPYFTVNHEQYNAILLGPQAKITFDIELPENPLFESAVTVPESFWNSPGDGVQFVVAIHHDGSSGNEIIYEKFIDPVHNKAERCWHDVEVDLSRYSNQKVRLVLCSYPVGNEATAWTDWTAWADPMIIHNPNKPIQKIVGN